MNSVFFRKKMQYTFFFYRFYGLQGNAKFYKESLRLQSRSISIAEMVYVGYQTQGKSVLSIDAAA